MSQQEIFRIIKENAPHWLTTTDVRNALKRKGLYSENVSHKIKKLSKIKNIIVKIADTTYRGDHYRVRYIEDEKEK